MPKSQPIVPPSITPDSPTAGLQAPPSKPAATQVAASASTDKPERAATAAKVQPRASVKLDAGATKFLSTRAPAALGFQIDLAVLELGMGGFACDKGELLAALVHEHVKSDEQKMAGLRRAIERYRAAF